MKKYITTSLLILSMLVGIIVTPSVSASAAKITTKTITCSNFKQCKPSVSVVSQSKKTVKLCINKVKGAVKYKVYCANSKNGTYKCIGSTKSTTFKDKIKSNETCYYKVKACMKKNSKIYKSKASNVVSNTTSKTVTTTTKPNTTTTTVKTEDTKVESADDELQKLTDEVLKLVNEERAKAGLSALTTNTTLQKAANKRAEEIVSSFSHTRPDGKSTFTVLDEYKISYRAAGENIAYGQSTASEVMNGWMNSSGHRANILGSQFGKVGIGIYKASNGVYYWTQLFTD